VGGSCQNCAKGQYKAATEDAEYYWKNIQSSPDWEDGCTVHAACGNGYYRSAHDKHSSGKCTLCAAGQFKDSAKMEACTECASLTCPAGTYRLGCGGARKGTCVACGAGSFSAAGNQNACTSCPEGKFSAPDGAGLTCAVCTAGWYQDETGALQCKSCGLGKFSDVPHANSASVCTDCAAGTYQSLHGQSDCTDCPAGTYQPSLGAPYLSHCVECAQGSYAGTGAKACTKCAAGKRGIATGLDTESNACTFCAAGTFTAEAGAATCAVCLKGTFGHHEGKHCVACAAGRYQAKDGSSECAECPVDTYASTTSHHACRACSSLDKSAHEIYWTNGVAGAKSCSRKPVPCKLSAWSNFGACSVSCGSGTRTQYRSVLAHAAGGGMACSEFKITNTEACAAIACAEDCQLAQWSTFGTCSKECGWGFEVRERKVARQPKAGGAQCGKVREQQPCRMRDCGCSHTTCSFSAHATLGMSRIEVHHHNKESFGSKHKCAYDRSVGQCSCECSGADGVRDAAGEAAFHAQLASNLL
jgi:syndecan 4